MRVWMIGLGKLVCARYIFKWWVPDFSSSSESGWKLLFVRRKRKNDRFCITPSDESEFFSHNFVCDGRFKTLSLNLFGEEEWLHLAKWETIIDMLDREWCSGLPKYQSALRTKLMFSLCNHMQSLAILKGEKYIAYIRQIGITQAISTCLSESVIDWASEHSDVFFNWPWLSFLKQQAER